MSRPIEVGSIEYHALAAKSLVDNARSRTMDENRDVIMMLIEAIKHLSLACEKLERRTGEAQK